MIIKPNASIRMFTLIEHGGFRYLGTIQRGLQIGALAITPEGNYVQVNGAWVQHLHAERVERALRETPMPPPVPRRSAPAAAPVVVHRKKRVWTPAEAGAAADAQAAQAPVTATLTPRTAQRVSIRPKIREEETA